LYTEPGTGSSRATTAWSRGRRPCAPAQTPEAGGQGRSLGPQLGQRRERQAPEHCLAATGDLDDDPAAVGFGPAPAYHPTLGQAVDQLDGRVVACLKALGQRPDRDRTEARQPPHLEQEKVLLGLDPGGPRRLFARPQKAADVVPKIGQGLVVDLVYGMPFRTGTSLHRGEG
jgi:hypothetical protein